MSLRAIKPFRTWIRIFDGIFKFLAVELLDLVCTVKKIEYVPPEENSPRLFTLGENSEGKKFIWNRMKNYAESLPSSSLIYHK
jgi:hypothetical protein